MDFKTEEKLRESIFPDLEQGRPGWDKPHTESVVGYAKEIAKREELDEDVLVIVAYAHDWGYADLFDAGRYVGREDIRKAKALHAKISEEKLAKLLTEKEFDYLSLERKERIRHIVLVHDEIESLSDRDELAFMEADTLGQLDVSGATPTFTAEDNERYMSAVAEKRIPKFFSEYGKAKAEELFHARRAFYKKNRQ